jgi:NADH:ubiquinone oxidoreductase subunit 2 (subunit N)
LAYASGFVFGQIMSIIGLVGSLIALYYYIYLIKIMVVDAPSNSIKALPEQACCFDLTKISASIAVFAMALVGIFGMSSLSEIAGKVILGLQF